MSGKPAIEHQYENRADNRSNEARGFALAVPPDGPAGGTSNNRSDYAEQSRDDDATGITSGHDEFCKRANDQPNNNHPKHRDTPFVMELGGAIGMPTVGLGV